MKFRMVLWVCMSLILCFYADAGLCERGYPEAMTYSDASVIGPEGSGSVSATESEEDYLMIISADVRVCAALHEKRDPGTPENRSGQHGLCSINIFPDRPGSSVVNLRLPQVSDSKAQRWISTAGFNRFRMKHPLNSYVIYGSCRRTLSGKPEYRCQENRWIGQSKYQARQKNSPGFSLTYSHLNPV